MVGVPFGAGLASQDSVNKTGIGDPLSSLSQHQAGSMKMGFVTMLSPPPGIVDTKQLKQL